MNSIDFIVNPAAAKGRAKELGPRIQAAMSGHSDAVRVIDSIHAGHATALARESSASVIVAVGGDGTINEVVNGIHGTDKILGVIPAGSGNDFVKSVDIPRAFDESLCVVISGKTKEVDVCSITTENGVYSSRRLFINGAGIGFDAEVAVRTKRMKYLGGTLMYVAAVFRSLGSYKAPSFEVSVDDMAFKGTHLLIAIGNGICSGGGFYLTPVAQVDDSLVDVCAIRELSIAGILRVMPKVMRGNHLSSKDIRYVRGSQVSVHSADSFHVHADGEIVGESVRDVTICVAERRLSVLVPRG